MAQNYEAIRMKKLLDGLEKPIRVLAPMYEVNDLAFRMMLRQHGIKLCFTGMINTHMWAIKPSDREKQFQTCPEDRPLIVQLNGSDESELIACANDVVEMADAIDINLGCTQHIARRGQYGYYMVNTEEKRRNVIKMVQKLTTSIKIPVTAKVRLLTDEDGNPSPELTTEFVKNLEKAGIAMISVHGRHQQLDKAGAVDAAAIRMIAENVSIPVIANGGIVTKDDSDLLLAESGAAATMIGQGLLKNPWMFDKEADPIAMGKEYLSFYSRYPCDRLIAKRHLFNFLEADIRSNTEVADKLKECWTIEELSAFLDNYHTLFPSSN